MKAEDRILSKRYARGYLDLAGRSFSAREEAAAASAVKDLAAVRAAIDGAMRALLHPLVGYSEKDGILSRLLTGELGRSRAAVFTRLLIREHRFHLLDAVIEDCGALYDLHAGITPASAVSGHPLDEAELRRISGALSAASGRKVRLTGAVSEKAVGGVEIRMGDLLIDATVKGRLERLKRLVLAD